jgi:hypothetical protein
LSEGKHLIVAGIHTGICALAIILTACLWVDRAPGGEPLTTKNTDPKDRAEQTISLPDRDDLGTGIIRIDISPGALPTGPIKTADFVPLEGPRISTLSVTVWTRHVTIELRRLSDANPVFTGTFSLSKNFDPMRRHVLNVEFAKWKVLSVKMDGKPLSPTKPGETEK